jgi:hypothetical protein
MSITPIAFQVNGGAASSTTTTAVNTTGANLLVVSVTGKHGTYTVSDLVGGNSNTWMLAFSYSNASDQANLYYCANPAHTGSGHTVTVTSSSLEVVVGFLAVSGASASPLDQHNGNTTGSTTIQPGSITPSQNGCLVVTNVETYTGNPTGVSGGGTWTDTLVNYVSSTVIGGGFGYLIQATAAAINPTWSMSVSETNAAAGIASFLPSAGVAVLPPGLFPSGVYQ